MAKNASGVKLDSYWKFREADDALFANADFDDTAWDTINIESLDDTNFRRIGGFRLHLQFDSHLKKGIILNKC